MIGRMKPRKRRKDFGKKVKTKSPSKKRGTFSQFEKKTGEHIYFVNLPKGEKTNDQIKDRIDGLNFEKINKGRRPDELVKITFVAKKNEKEKQAFTNIYRVDNLKEVPDAIAEIWGTITKTPTKQGKDYMKRINKLRGYVNLIIVDFETAGMKT